MKRARVAVVTVACALSSLLLGTLGLPAAVASSSPPPGSPTATFDGWQSGADLVTVSWDPVDGATRYGVTYLPGDFTVDTIGSGFPFGSVTDGSTSIQQVLPEPLNAGDVTFLIQPNGPSGNMTPAVAIVHIPGPTLTATPVSGVVGQANLSWAAANDGDTLILRRGTTGHPATPEDGSPVDLGSGNNELITGLGTGTAYFAVFEEPADSPSDYSPGVQLDVRGAPAADGDLYMSADMSDPTTPVLVWKSPAGCNPPVQYICDRDLVRIKEGTTASSDPSDGQPIPGMSDSDTVMNPPMVRLSGMAIGHTYTVTVFNTTGSVADSDLVYSPAASITWTNRVIPDMEFTESPSTATALGEPVTLRATVTDGFVTPTGTVSFSTDRHPLCGPVSLPASGVVTCHTNTSDLYAGGVLGDPGNSDLTASYSGDNNDQDASQPLEFVITKATPTVVAQSKSTKKALLETAKVTGKAGAPRGTVRITKHGKTLCRSITLKHGKATCRIPRAKLKAGKNAVRLTYSGDRHYRARNRSITIKLH